MEFIKPTIEIPYEYLIPNYKYESSILFFHGFNNATEDKIAIINQRLFDNNLNDSINLMTPHINYNTNHPFGKVNELLDQIKH